jgi:hypothetical protein
VYFPSIWYSNYNRTSPGLSFLRTLGQRPISGCCFSVVLVVVQFSSIVRTSLGNLAIFYNRHCEVFSITHVGFISENVSCKRQKKRIPKIIYNPWYFLSLEVACRVIYWYVFVPVLCTRVKKFTNIYMYSQNTVYCNLEKWESF